MLSPKEKEEMKNDAQCDVRRESFRIAQSMKPLKNFDDYLKFLSQVQKTFDRISNQVQNPAASEFKL